MRTTAAILLLLAAPALFAATTYEARSAQHVVTVDLEGEGEAREYAVRVTDHATGALLVSERLTGANRQAKVEADGRTIRVAAHEMNGNLSITLFVQRNGATIDSINASFLTKRMTGVPPIPPPPPPLAMEGVHRVGGEVKAPVVISRVEPVYPEDARKARVSGIVIVEAVIDEEGRVANARVLKPLPFGLDQSALDAVRQWRFRPGTLDGQPVKVLFNLTINFRLPELEGQ